MIDLAARPLSPAIRATEPFGLRRAALHEFYAATEADAAAVTGLMLAVAMRAPLEQPVLMVRQDFLDREAGSLYPPGLREFGIDPSRIICLRARDTASALQAALEGARCAGLGAVILEIWGEAKALDLTASRRLALAAEASGALVLMGRIAARPCPSAAETRWGLQSAPSRALAANAPGNPAFSLRLLRHRGGQAPGVWHGEWNRDRTRLEITDDRSDAPLSGGILPVPLDRQNPARQGRRTG